MFSFSQKIQNSHHRVLRSGIVVDKITVFVDRHKVIKFLHNSDRVSLLVRRQIRVRKREGKVNFLIAGEKFKVNETITEFLLNRYPEEANDEDLGKQNKDITIVGLF